MKNKESFDYSQIEPLLKIEAAGGEHDWEPFDASEVLEIGSSCIPDSEYRFHGLPCAPNEDREEDSETEKEV